MLVLQAGSRLENQAVYAAALELLLYFALCEAADASGAGVNPPNIKVESRLNKVKWNKTRGNLL